MSKLEREGEREREAFREKSSPSLTAPKVDFNGCRYLRPLPVGLAISLRCHLAFSETAILPIRFRAPWTRRARRPEHEVNLCVDSSRFCHGLMGTFNPAEEGVQHGSTGCCFPSSKGILAPFWSSQVQLEQEDLLADSLKKEIVRRVERDAMEAREEALLLGSGDGKGVRGSPTGYDGLWWIMGMWMIIWMVTWMLGDSEWFWTSIEWYGWLWTMNWWMILHDYWWLHGWFWMMRDD